MVHASVLIVAVTALLQQPPQVVLGERVFALRADDGSSPESFSNVADVAMDSHGRLYVFHSERNDIQVVNSTGRIVTTLGGPGRGPGLFFVPRAIDVDETGRVYAYDVGTQRVSIYRWNGATLELSAHVPAAVDASDICAMKGVFYLQGLDEDRLIHGFESNGKRVDFGESFGSGSRLARRGLSNGLLGCFPKAGMILVGSNMYPEIRAYRQDGTLAWAKRLARYLPTSVRDNDGSVTFSSTPAGVHLLKSLVVVDDSTAALQLALTSPQNELVELETRLIAVQDGVELSKESSLPLIAATRAPLICTFGEGVPLTLLVHRFSVTGHR